MAIVSVIPGWTGVGGNDTNDGRTFSQDSTLVYTVVTNDPANDTCDTVLDSADVPQPGAADPNGSSRKVRQRHAEQISPVLYKVTITLNSPTRAGAGPLDEPPIIDYSTGTVEEECDYDADGKLICTVNGEPYDPPPKRKFKLTKVVITRNLATFDEEIADLYVNTTNSSTFRNRGKGTCYLESITGRTVNDPDQPYVVVTATILIRKGLPGVVEDEKAWYQRRLHQGYKVKNTLTVGGNSLVYYTHAVDSNGEWVTKPVLLDDDGTEITPNSDGTPPNAKFKLYKQFSESDFNAMGLL